MVAAALAEELAMLSASARSVLDGAAVAGDPFELDLAAIAAATPEPEALDALDVLLRLDLVRSTDMPRRFRFRHPIVRRAVYEATRWRLAAGRARANRRRALAQRGAGAAARAHHVERSARHGDAPRSRVLREAGEQSALRAPATAAPWFRARTAAAPRNRAGPGARRAPARARAGAGGDRPVPREPRHLLESIAIVLRGLARAARSARRDLRARRTPPRPARTGPRSAGRALDELPDQASPEAVSLMIELAMDGAAPPGLQGNGATGAPAPPPRRDSSGTRCCRATAVAAYARAAAFAAATQQAEAACTEAAALVDALSDDELARRLDAAAHLASAEFYFHRFDEASAHAERALAIGRATGQGQLFPLIYAVLGHDLAADRAGSQRPSSCSTAPSRPPARRGNAHTLAWSLYARSTVALAAGDIETALATGQEAFDITDDGKPSHTAGAAARGPRPRSGGRQRRAGGRAARALQRRRRHAA